MTTLTVLRFRRYNYQRQGLYVGWIDPVDLAIGYIRQPKVTRTSFACILARYYHCNCHSSPYCLSHISNSLQRRSMARRATNSHEAISILVHAMSSHPCAFFGTVPGLSLGKMHIFSVYSRSATFACSNECCFDSPRTN